MKCSSEQLDSFSIWPSFCKRSNSVVTLGCGFIGTRPLFWCFAVNLWWNFDFATCVLDRLIPDTKWGNCAAIVSLILHAELLMLLTYLSVYDWCCCTTARPRLGKRSLPMMILWPSSTTVRRASLSVQLFYATVVSRFPRTWIGSFENVLRSRFSFLMIHFADCVFRIIWFASVFVMRLTALPESIIAFAFTSPNCSLTFKGSSWFAESDEIAAT